MIRIIPQPLEIKETGSFCENAENIDLIKNISIKSPEGYRLEIHKDAIKIYACADRGFFYGKMTLKQLAVQYGNKLPCVIINDVPAYPYRGIMIDCARHMVPVDELKKMLDLAATLKFNKFHWHLSDDQGFRIELDSFPQLTRQGSIRKGDNFGSMCRSDKPYSGYYKKAEIREIVEFCRERFIDVIPEIDMPGHTSAILHVFPELSCRMMPVDVKTRQGIYKDNLCIGKPEAFELATKITDELCELFPYEYFHIGGDEAPDDYRNNCVHCQKAIKENHLKNSAQLQCLFANKMSEHLKAKGKKSIVWNDILKGKSLNKDITVQRWMDPMDNALEAANNGSKIIISEFKPYYLDYPYGMYPLKNVYNFVPSAYKKLTKAGRSNIIGVETPVWTEFIDNNNRLEYLCLPRWFAVAENGWSLQKNKNYAQFKSAADRLSKKLCEKGYNCADGKEVDMPVPKRLTDTAKFFIAFLSNKE